MFTFKVITAPLIKPEQSHKDSKEFLDRQQKIDYLLILSKILIECPYNTQMEKKIKDEAETQVLKTLESLK